MKVLFAVTKNGELLESRIQKLSEAFKKRQFALCEDISIELRKDLSGCARKVELEYDDWQNMLSIVRSKYSDFSAEYLLKDDSLSKLTEFSEKYDEDILKILKGLEDGDVVIELPFEED